jgi:hypothetical protein
MVVVVGRTGLLLLSSWSGGLLINKTKSLRINSNVLMKWDYCRCRPQKFKQNHTTNLHIGFQSRVVDPETETLWIWICIGNPDPGSGSRGKKIKKFQWKNAIFSYF